MSYTYYLPTTIIPYKQSAQELIFAALNTVTKQLETMAHDNPLQYAMQPVDEKTTRSLHEIRQWRQRYKPSHVILVGIGGSYFGAQALYDAFAAFDENAPQALLVSITSIDTTSKNSDLTRAIQIINTYESSCIVIVSKTGSSFETAAQAAYLLELIPKKQRSERVYIITDDNSPLRTVAQQEKISHALINPYVGGRFSVFSPAGCGVLELCGINTDTMRNQASTVTFMDAYEDALFILSCMQAGMTVLDTFLFIPSLEKVGGWIRQLLGESLGKNGKGILPTVSVGSLDLHSVVQYYMGGFGKQSIATEFIIPKTYNNIAYTLNASSILEQAGLSLPLSLKLLQKSIIDGVIASYKEAAKPYCVTSVDMNTRAIAAYMQYKMHSTVLVGMAIEINPFNQPNVQAYKKNTRSLLLS